VYSGEICIKVTQIKVLVDERHISPGEVLTQFAARDEVQATANTDDNGWQIIVDDFIEK